MPLRSPRERLLQTLAFEAGGLGLTIPCHALLREGPAQEGALLLGALTLAVVLWSPLHNALFDWAEWRASGRSACARPARLRIVHAVSHEVSAVAVSLPILLTLGGLGLAEALMTNLALTLFYTGYAYVFHLCYDRLRPVGAAPQLPACARGAGG